MLTIFSVPKSFHGHIRVIQRNAIQSWLRVHETCEVILLGDDEGTAEVAAEFKVHNTSNIERNEYGTPLVSSVFAEAQKVAHHSLMCYLNADIILMSDFLPAIQRVLRQKPSCLIVGRRWDIDMKEPLDFSTSWEEKLKPYVARYGKLHGHSGIDYFVFPRGLLTDIPPFAIGRPMWDNWVIYRIRAQKVPVVDITKMVTVVHQNHDYSHHPQKEEGVRKGEEAKHNWMLAGGYVHAFTLADATYKLTQKGLRLNLSPYYFYRHLVRLSEKYRFLKLFIKFFRLGRRSPDPFVTKPRPLK